MLEESAPKRRGRPPTGETPKRNIRIGAIWDDCVEQAKADGQSMTEFVAEAIERELARRKRLAARQSSQLPSISRER